MPVAVGPLKCCTSTRSPLDQRFQKMAWISTGRRNRATSFMRDQATAAALKGGPCRLNGRTQTSATTPDKP